MSRTIAYVGCRTTCERNAKGKGISVHEVHRTGAWQHLQTLETLANPTFLALNGAHDTLYAVHGDQNEVSAYRVERQSGLLSPIDSQTGIGRNPVHIEFSRDDSSLVIAGYASACITRVPLCNHRCCWARP